MKFSYIEWSITYEIYKYYKTYQIYISHTRDAMCEIDTIKAGSDKSTGDMWWNIKPGLHERHKHEDKINTKTKHDITSGTCKDKTRVGLCFVFVRLLAYAWTTILCLCLSLVLKQPQRSCDSRAIVTIIWEPGLKVDSESTCATQVLRLPQSPR